MNERIKELAKQASNYVNEVYTGPVRSKTPGKIWEDGHVGWHTQFNEKFAELIVAEATKALWTEECMTSDLALAEYSHNSNRIRDHFGL